MADNPQRPVTTIRAATRPLSPHMTIYRWPVTMMTSITHRITGGGMAIGMIVLAWWLVCVSNGPEGWESFHAIWNTSLGLLVLFGLTWSLVYHFLNGVRHLAWDLGYGFDKRDAERNSVIIFALSILGALAVFAAVWTGHAGYLQ
jgi:succinate dehydrogenase / fumarate reductase cytochrome b subunit